MRKLWNDFLVAAGLRREQIIVDFDDDLHENPEVQEPIDPDQEIFLFETTKGDMDRIQHDLAQMPHLRNQITELSYTVDALTAENRTLADSVARWERFWATAEATQRRAIRRMFRLPKTLARLLDLEPGEPTVLSDGVVRYPLIAGQDIVMFLDIEPFRSKITAVDNAEHETDLELTLSRDGGNDAYRELVLMLRGFGDTIKHGNGNTTTWVDEVNKVTAPDVPSGAPTARNTSTPTPVVS
jgi:hypothetical protein